MSACAAVVFAIYVEPILAIELHSTYSLSNGWIGGFFLMSAATYVIGAPFSSYLSNYLSKRTIIVIAFTLLTV